MKLSKSTTILLNVVLILAVVLLIKSLIFVPKNLYATTTQRQAPPEPAEDISLIDCIIYDHGPAIYKGGMQEQFEKSGFKLFDLQVVVWDGVISLVGIYKRGK